MLTYGMVGGSMSGFIGEVHRKAINFDPRAKMVAGCFSTDAIKNKQVQEVYSVDRIYSNYAEMAQAEGERPDGIDFVVIVTPNSTHYDIAKHFLLNGINVVCEKPLCFSIEQAEDLERIVKEKNLVFAVTYTYTGYTLTRVMKDMIAEGKIGNILSVNAEYIQDWLLDEVTSPGSANNLSVWRKDPKLSGISNCVGDIGSHIENYIHYVTGLKIKRLLATTNTFGQKLDLNANIIVEYDNGANGAYWCSQVASGRLNDLYVRIYGDLGSLEWRQEQPDVLKYTPKGQATEVISRGTSYIKENSASEARVPSGHPEGLFVAFANIYRDVISDIIARKNNEPFNKFCSYPSITDGLNGVKFIHAVIDSAKNNSGWQEI
ncbi:oxidoreductase [Candidatus Epulonipiscioides saccharophilum]|nr:oxidoreductase [Epulopiscium sp. SCG-B10WGA-EpuloB]